MHSLGHQINALRSMRGFGLREFAGMIETDPGHLSRIEADQKLPSAALLDRIVKSLELQPGALDPWAMQAVYSAWRSSSGVFHNSESA